MKNLFGWLAALISTILLAIWRGIVLKVIWGWFFVPLFGLPSLSTGQAMGVGLVITYLTLSSIKKHEPGWEVWVTAILTAFTYGLFVLAFGWFIKSFI